ncbi:HAD family hydrolase [Acinetobacter sp. CFCC 11171]|uniref:HAD family hydrolase n=1 Tax=Acinetobacter sp. CFCC 11171 TaxID=1775558 RepID=UPI000DCFC006|nr:HAD family hydrolase [Acinetobacter sp. CFCC 11171]
MQNKYKIIVFDAFGTLVKIGQSRSPYRKLMKWLREECRKPSTQDAYIIMSNSVDIAELAKIFGKVIPTPLLGEISDDLDFELKTIELYEDTVSILKKLKNRGFKIAICSNLAMPYGERLKELFPDIYDALVFSYEIQAIKPDRKIYESIQQEFGCQMSDILFIGDNPLLDVETPIRLGMSAMLIERDKMQGFDDILVDLLKN